MNDQELMKKIEENDFIFLGMDNFKDCYSKRCVLVQNEAVHEEIIPSLVYILNLLGFHVDVYLSQVSVSRKGNIFKFFKEISYRLFLVNFAKNKTWKSFTSDVATENNYDLLIANTFQRDSICQWLNSIQIPSVCIVHNVDIFLKQNCCIRHFVDKSNACPMFLARHVYDYATKQDSSWSKLIPKNSFIYPIYFENLEAKPKLLRSKNCQYPKEFVVQGTINYANRDYEELITAVAEISKSKTALPEFKISIVGSGKDKEKLFNEIKNKKIQQFFKFVEPEYDQVSYESYYDRILAGDFLLPLISNPRADYLNNKISSSLMIVLGMKTIPVINSAVAKTYGIDNIQYDGKNLKAALVNALEIDYPSYMRLRLAVKSKSLLFLDESVQNMESVLAKINVTSSCN